MMEIEKLIESEIVDFFAGFGHPGEPETPEEMQSQLLARVMPMLAGLEQEPVAYYFPGGEREIEQVSLPDDIDDGQKANCIPLYAAPQLPQPAVVITNEEIDRIVIPISPDGLDEEKYPIEWHLQHDRERIRKSLRDYFSSPANPATVLALLDELEVKDSTIAAQQHEIRTLLNALEGRPCPKCNDTGMEDSGGTQPWGEPIEIECDCRQQDANTAELVAAGIITKVGE